MSDPQTDILIKAAAGLFTEIFKGAYKTSLGWIKGKNETHDFFNKKAMAYGKKMAERYNNMKVLGMSEPRPLSSIFVRANILEKITAREYAKLEDLEDQFDFQKRGFGKKKETKPGLEVAQSLQKFIVLGKPGAGKTTFLKRIVLHSLEGDFTYHRLPIFIGLKEYSESGKTLFEYIVQEFDICSLPDAEPFITNILKNGKGQILLDGLDEVKKENEDRVIQEVKNLYDKYDDCQYILSCRIAGFNTNFEHFTDVEIADFNDQQIQQFITNWFQKEPKVGEECWAKIESNAQIKELATVPLLLTLLCILYDKALNFPDNRAELYEEAIDTMLKEWDSTRRIKRSVEKTYEGLSLKKRKALLSVVAFQTFSYGEFFIPKRRLTKLIGSYIENLPQIKENLIEVESQEVLKSIITQNGLIVQRAKDIYSYSHLSLQEYFTAHFLISGPRPEKLIKHAIEGFAREPQWREIFLLTAGMLDNADQFMISLRRCIDQYVIENKLKTFLSEIDLMIKPDSSLRQSVGGRRPIVIVFFFTIGLGFANTYARRKRTGNFATARRHFAHANTLLLALDRALASALGLAQPSTRVRGRALTRNLARDLAHDRNLNLNLDFNLSLNFRYALSLIDALAPYLAHTLLNAHKSVHTLTPYIQLNLLLLDCLNSGAYISKSIRKGILDNLFLPPKEKKKKPKKKS